MGRRVEHDSSSLPKLRFGPFEFDRATGELWQADRVMRLPPQPSRVLALLAGRPGRVVTREELRRQVWGDETCVDFDLALNFLVNRIRLALGDDARKPRYVETLPRRGYRFVAPVEVLHLAAPPTLAVLPFDDLNRDPEQESFANGMADVVITELAKIRSLHVLARQTVLHLKGSQRSLAEIGRDLGVDALLEGSVLRVGSGVRVTVQLVEVDPERHIWSQEYESEMQDVLGLQSRLARAIAERVAANLSADGSDGRPESASADREADLSGRPVPSPAPDGGGGVEVGKTLEQAQAEKDAHKPAGSVRSRRRRALVWAGGAWLLAVTFGATAWLALSRRVPSPAIPKVGSFASKEGSEYDAAFAPDGKQIAYVWDGEKEDNIDVYVQLVDEANPRRLTTDPAADFSPVWSPDGVYIAFLRRVPQGVDVRLVPSAGGTERSLHVSRAFCDFALPIHNRQFCGLAWAPDGRSLAIVDKESPEAPNSIYLLDVESRARRRLTTPPADWFGDGVSVFSPDGRTLAFARSRHTHPSDIYLLPLRKNGDAAGDPRPITHDDAPILGLDWTPDGRGIVFSSQRGGPQSLWRVTSAGGEPERLVFGGEGSYWPSIARKGNRLAYTSSTIAIQIWRVALPGPGVSASAAAAPFISSPFHEVHAAFSADGRRIAFTSGRSGNWDIWTCDRDGSRATRLTRLDGGAVFPKWSPDGRRIAFGLKEWKVDARDQAYVVDAEGGTPRRIASGDFDEAAPVWSHDGRWIYFMSDRGDGCSLWKVPADGAAPVRVLRQCGRLLGESRDGASVFYSVMRRVLRAPVTGGAATLVLEKPPHALLALAESGIYVFDPDPQGGPAIALFSFATGRLRTLLTLPPGPHRYIWGANGFAVSPDERLALFEHLDGRAPDIMLVEGFR